MYEFDHKTIILMVNGSAANEVSEPLLNDYDPQPASTRMEPSSTHTHLDISEIVQWINGDIDKP